MTILLTSIWTQSILNYKPLLDLLEDTLKENGLMHSPSQIFNVDESGMPLDPKAPSILAKRGTKKVPYIPIYWKEGANNHSGMRKCLWTDNTTSCYL